MISEPSSTHKLFIIQIGMWHMPSSAENSSTPQYVLMPICEFEIIKVIGYWMRNLASSCSALVGKITAKGFTKKHVSGNALMDLTLTLIASVEFWFADEGWTVDLVAAQEDISWVSIAPTYIA